MKEVSFVMVKPDAFERGLVGEIVDTLEQRGSKLIALKTVTLTPEDCERHYSHHVHKDFYPNLVKFMTSGPSLALLFEGDNVCTLLRQLIGNSKHPSQVPAGSIRGRYALDFPRNLVHGSDSYEDAMRESEIYLTIEEIFDEERIADLKAAEAYNKKQREAVIKKKLAKGINLGEEVFSPYLLKKGDWVVTPCGIYNILDITPSPAGIVVTFIGYTTVGFGLQGAVEHPDEPYMSSFDWFGDIMVLVGRNDKFDKLQSAAPVVVDEMGHARKFKDGKFLPVFKKKNKQIKKTMINGWKIVVQTSNTAVEHIDLVPTLTESAAQKLLPLYWQIAGPFPDAYHIAILFKNGKPYSKTDNGIHVFPASSDDLLGEPFCYLS